MSPSETPDPIARRDALAGRLFEATLGLMDLGAIHIGDRLGLYRGLERLGPATASELAAETGTQERYVREWLEQQAVSGLLDVDDAARPAPERRYTLPPGHGDVLVDPESLSTMTPLAQFGVGVIRAMPALLEAFRTGGGVSWGAFGADVREAQAAQNRPAFLHLLGQEWLPAVPDLHARLRADPPARVADVACGAGWSAIGIARAYPKVRVDGLDLDAPSIELARANVAEAGLADRITHGRPRRRRSRPGGPVRSRHDLRVAPRHVAPRRRPAGVPATPRARRLGPGRRRAGGGRLRRAGRPGRAPDVRLQRALLPPGRHGRSARRPPPAR